MDRPNQYTKPQTNIISSAPVLVVLPPTFEDSKLSPLLAPPSGGNQFMFMLNSGQSSIQQLRQLTIDEVALHNKVNDCWTVINSKVYDITSYLQYHPGGRSILKAAGKDGTEIFQKFHPSVNVEAVIGRLQIGYLGIK